MILDSKTFVLVVFVLEGVLVSEGMYEGMYEERKKTREHYFIMELPPWEVRYPMIPRGINFEPYELLYSPGNGIPSFPGYYLPDTGSTRNHTALSLSTINSFGVKAPQGTDITLKLIHEKRNGTILEFNLGGRECSLNVRGMSRKGLWVSSHSRVQFSNDTYKWFTLERSPNYIAIYDSRNQEYPLLDFDNVDDDDIDFHHFERYSVSSHRHPALWDFLGYTYDTPRNTETPDNSVILNPYVRSALLDVQEQYLRYVRERWRCQYINQHKDDGRVSTIYEERNVPKYLMTNCREESLLWCADMERRLKTILLVHGFALPSRTTCDNSELVFKSHVFQDRGPIAYYTGN